MKFINALTILASAMAVTAAPTAEAEVDAAVDSVNAAPLEARVDLNAAECRTACKTGLTAIRIFCRAVPNPVVKAGCLVAAAVVKTEPGVEACVTFCDANF